MNIEYMRSEIKEWSCKVPHNLSSITTKLPLFGSRVVFKLYWEVAPLACENFATLCTNGSSLDLNSTKKPKPAPTGECGKALSYKNSTIHRVVPGFIIQGGDFVFGNGSGGESIFNGKKFKDERAGLALKHDRAGILSMGNSGKNSNTSQFFVTLDKAPQCDGKHVVFGEVVSGMEVLTAVEKFGSSSGGEPSVPITITDCGVYVPLWTPGSGAWFDRPDSESFSGITPEFLIRQRVGILAPSKQVADKFQTVLGEHASTLYLVAEDIEGRDECIVKAVLTPLENFALDVILAAPACAGLLSSMDVPCSWIDAVNRFPDGVTVPNTEEVFLVSKPVDALNTIMNDSWVARRHGWLLSGSFA